MGSKLDSVQVRVDALESKIQGCRRPRRQYVTSYYDRREGRPKPADLMAGVSPSQRSDELIWNDDQSVAEILIPDKNYWSDFDYERISLLTDLPVDQVADLHREYLMLASSLMGSDDTGSQKDELAVNYDQFSAMFLNRVKRYSDNLSGDPEFIRKQAVEFCQRLFRSFDSNNDERIDFCEFICSFLKVKGGLTDEQITSYSNRLLEARNNSVSPDVEKEAKELLMSLASTNKSQASRASYQTASF